MAQLTRKFLRALGVEEDKIDEIVTAHQDTLDAIKAERDGLKTSADKLAEAQAEVTRLTSELEKAKSSSGDAAKVQADFDAYRQQVDKERADALNTSDLLDIAREAGVQRESFRSMIARDFDMGRIQRGEDGKVSNRAELVEAIKSGYADCIGEITNTGTPPTNPPPTPPKTISRDQLRGMKPEEINANWEAVKQSFGIK